MNPVRTVEVREWVKQAGHHAFVIAEYGTRDPQPYCSQCGMPTVIAVEQASGFDPTTGKRWLKSYAVCPNRLGMLSRHTREQLRIDQDELQRLLYLNVLDATLPDSQ